MKTVKNIIMIFALVASFFSATAQEKGSYLSLGAGVGPTGLHYEWDGIRIEGIDKIRLGGNFHLGYSYFFSQHWGIGTALGISCYNSQAQYNRSFYDNEYWSLGTQTGGDNINLLDPNQEGNHNYELRARLSWWKENQHALTFDIPLQAQYQTLFGTKKKLGLYAGLGLQVHFPLKSTFKVVDSNANHLNISGVFESSGIEYGLTYHPSVAWHGFGSIPDPEAKLRWRGDNNLKFELSALGNLGLIWKLSRRTDLLTGLFLDYGLTNVKKDSENLLTAPANYSKSFYNTQTDETTGKPIGSGIKYAGIINSNLTDRVTLLSYGLEVGLRMHLGHLPKKPKNCCTPYEQCLENPYDYTVVVIDKDKNKPVQGAMVNLGDKLMMTGENGSVTRFYSGSNSFTTGVKAEGYNYTEIRSQLDGKPKTDKIYLQKLLPPYIYQVIVKNADTGKPIANQPVDVGGQVLITDENGLVTRIFDEPTAFTTKINGVGYKNVDLNKILPTGNSTILTDVIELKVDEGNSIILHNIYYDFDKSVILPESKTELDKVVKFLKDNPDRKIELSSHTDSRGTKPYNQRLSQRRAKSAVDYIISQGIDKSRITAKGYGETRLLNRCADGVECTEQEHRYNRRTEIFIPGVGAAENIKQTKGRQ